LSYPIAIASTDLESTVSCMGTKSPKGQSFI